MYIKEIKLKNWLIYKGEHTIKVNPIVYGVIAKQVDNEDRSNWCGKSSLLNAIRFALYGKRPASISTEDGWITRKTTTGGVELLLSNDTKIERSRTKGKATRLKVTLANGKESFDADAQDVLTEHLGLSSDDFINTCFFEQRQIAKFVMAKPGERMEIIAAWLKLEPIQKAEKRVRGELELLYKKEADHMISINVLKEIITRTLNEYFDDVATISKDEVLDELKSLFTEKDRYCLDLAEEKNKLTTWLADLRSWMNVSKEAKKYYFYLDKAKEICDYNVATNELSRLSLDEFEPKLEQLGGEIIVAFKKYQQASQLVKGEFDGKCPIDGHLCSDRDPMNKMTCESRKRLADADVRLQKAKFEHGELKKTYNSILAKRERLKVLLNEYDWNLKTAESYKKYVDEIQKRGEPDISIESVQTQVDRATELWYSNHNQLENLGKNVANITRAFDEIEKKEQIIQSIRNSIKVHQQAVVILGKNGVQRRLAETALNQITEMANNALREAGIDLTVSVRWSREGTGLADDCSVCGAAYPKGRGVKQCVRCGAERGAKLIEKIEVELSDVSGAAEDLAGVVISLSAGAWLRASRDASWSCVCIDEAFGSLDVANCSALSTHLAALISQYGFEQAFIVSHTRGVNDLMPGRIVITATEEGSSINV